MNEPTPPPSPLVTAHAWGRIEVAGIGSLKDAKLWPGGGRAWDWTETGTEHRPGIQVDDVAELLDHAPQVVVLSRGRRLRLETMPETLVELERHGVEVIRAETGEAVETYNRLAAERRPVAALLHSTC